MSDQQLL